MTYTTAERIERIRARTQVAAADLSDADITHFINDAIAEIETYIGYTFTAIPNNSLAEAILTDIAVLYCTLAHMSDSLFNSSDYKLGDISHNRSTEGFARMDEGMVKAMEREIVRKFELLPDYESNDGNFSFIITS